MGARLYYTEDNNKGLSTTITGSARQNKSQITCMARNGVSMVSVVNLVVVMVGMVVVIQVIVVFNIGMPVTEVIVLMLGGIGMGTGQELGINVM